MGGERLHQLVEVRDGLLAAERRARDLREREPLEHLAEELADGNPPRALVQAHDGLVEAAHVGQARGDALGIEWAERVGVAQMQEVAIADRAQR